MKSTALSNGQASTSSPAAPAPGYGGSSRDELLAIYRTMLLSRRHRRQGNPAQEPEPDLLPDQWRRTRSRSSSRPGSQLQRRLRLVLSLLSRSRALPGPRRHAARDAPRRRRRQGRPGQRRPSDAVALGPRPSATSSRSRARPARSASRRSAAPKPACSTSSSPPSRTGVRASSRTRSPTSRSATARRAKANSGNR